MAIITLLTDYGNKDHYSAAIKAKILKADPKAHIIDISHNVPPYNIIHAAQVLKSVYADFAEGTVHLVDVFAHGQGNRTPIALKLDGYFFLGPNNGIFSLLTRKNPDLIVDLVEGDQGRKSFPAKNILAQIAVELAYGKELSSLGTPCKEFMSLRHLECKVTKNQIQGFVVHIDHYGNAITNIDKATFDKLLRDSGPKFSIEFGRERTESLTDSYTNVPEGEIVAFFNDQDLLEIAICEGNASALLGLEFDSLVRIEFREV